ncbi:hypothetical protein BT96DRAFT_794066, partial [Gymnopus androsaceus JB14]
QIEHTPAYSSAMNGVAERKHGITFAKVRVILHDSGLPEFLWALAGAYVVYTENLLPHCRKRFSYPRRIVLAHASGYFPPAPLGTRGWATRVEGNTLGKMEMQAFEGRMVGYGERGVYLLYTSDGKVVASRDVTFEEGCPSRTLSPVAGEDIVDQGNDEFIAPDTTNATDTTEIRSEEVKSDQTLDQTNDQVPIQEIPPIPSSSIPTPSTRKPRTKFQPNPNIPLQQSPRVPPSETASEEQHQANLTTLVDMFNEVTADFNTALTAIGIPPVPKSYVRAMEDPERWSPAIDKEIQRIQEFDVF